MLPTVFDRSFWRAAGDEPVLNEDRHRALMLQLLKRGARWDAVFPDLFVDSYECLRLERVGVLDRVLLQSPPSSLASRLELLYGHGLPPDTAPLGLEEMLMRFCQAVCNSESTALTLCRKFLPACLFEANRHWADKAAWDVGVIGYLTARTLEERQAPDYLAGLRVALEHGVSAQNHPGFINPLDLAVSGWAYQTVGAHVAPADRMKRAGAAVMQEVVSLLLQHGASLEDPPVLFLKHDHLFTTLPATLADAVGCLQRTHPIHSELKPLYAAVEAHRLRQSTVQGNPGSAGRMRL